MRLSSHTVLPNTHKSHAFCICQGTLWYLDHKGLHTSSSVYPFEKPPPMETVIALNPLKEDYLLITTLSSLWLFHIPSERFSRFAGKQSAESKDGTFPKSRFRCISAIWHNDDIILVVDAGRIRLANLKTETIQTLALNISFGYITGIALKANMIYLLDIGNTCIWRYHLEEETFHKENHPNAQAMGMKDDEIWLCSASPSGKHLLQPLW